MKIVKAFYIIILLVLFSSCVKDGLITDVDETNVTQKALYSQNGILVFDSQESFDKTLKEVQCMNTFDKNVWEEKLSFKSFDRLISDAFNAQNKYEEKYSYLNDDELKKELETGKIKEYSPEIEDLIKTGKIDVLVNENNERTFDIQYPMYSSLVNVDGFVVVGNEILQYSKNKFKLIKSRDFSKINRLDKMKENVNNSDYFVTDIITGSRQKIELGSPIFIYSAESYSTDRQKVVATETYRYYDRKYNGTNYEANYSLLVENKIKKYKWFHWDWYTDENTRTWVWGDFDFYTKENGTFNVPLNYPDISFGTKTFTMIKTEFSRFDYNSANGGPEVIRSTWYVSRWGGSNGLGVRLINHVKYERF